jgi:uncharacterized protein involved in outer membrane biogenesis
MEGWGYPIKRQECTNTQHMKRIFVIIGSVVALLIVLMIVVPVIFKGKIAATAKKMANEAINAKVDFSNVELSLFKNFPQLNISLRNLSVTGTGDFDNYLLLRADAFSTSVNISSIWKSNGLTISEINLDRPVVRLKVNKAGKENWNISKSTQVTETTQKKSETKIELKSIRIKDASLRYDDETMPMLFSLADAQFRISGEMKGSNSLLDIEGTADSLIFDYDSTRYAKNLKASVKGTLQADFDKMSFTFMKNNIMVNKLPLEAQGTFIIGEKDQNYDITFNSPSSSLGDLLGFIPEQYQKYIKDVETRGNVSFNGFIKGKYDDKTIPGLGVNMKVENGRLKYPKLPKEVENINISANINKDGGIMDLTHIDVDKFEASVAGNPLSASLHVATPVSDPQLKGMLKGKIDFTSLKQAIPMDSVDLRGVIEALIDFDGKYSSIEKEQYENFKTTGTVSMRNFEYASKSLTQKVMISTADMKFIPKTITLTNLSGNMGPSDFSANGSLSNYWPYILNKGTLTGNLNLQSDNLDVNVLTPASSKADTTLKSKPFEIPDNINLVIKAVVDRMNFDKLNITGLNGTATVKSRQVMLDGLNMNMLGGKMLISGDYSTPKALPPSFDLKMNIKNFDLPSAFRSISTVRYLVPMAGESTGAFDTDLSLSGKLANDYSPIYSSLNGDGLLSARNIELVGTALFSEIAKYFRKDMFKQIKISDFTTKFKMTEGGLMVSPFNTKIAGQDVVISGKQSAAKALDYRLDFKVNKSDLSEDVNKYFGFVPGTENIQKLPIGVVINGTMTKPDVKVDLSDAKKLVETEFKKKAGMDIQDAIKNLGLDKLFK